MRVRRSFYCLWTKVMVPFHGHSTVSLSPHNPHYRFWLVHFVRIKRISSWYTWGIKEIRCYKALDFFLLESKRPFHPWSLLGTVISNNQNTSALISFLVVSSPLCVFPISSFNWSIQQHKWLFSLYALAIVPHDKTSPGTSIKNRSMHHRTALNGLSSTKWTPIEIFGSSVHFFTSLHSSHCFSLFKGRTRVTSPAAINCS